jgi:hypothetical protein
MAMVPDHCRPPAPSLSQKIAGYSAIGSLFRFLTWWLIFTGIYGSSSVCPFCGQPGCPVGGLSAGVVGGAFALLVTKGRSWLSRLAGWFSRRRAGLPPQTPQ